jgi:spore maturation protein CgeB
LENEHYLGFSDVEEMLLKIAWVNEYPAEAMEMAKRARDLVLMKHRYYHRALRMFTGDW